MNEEEQRLFDRQEKLYPLLDRVYGECTRGKHLQMVWRGGKQITLNLPGTPEEGVRFAGEVAELIEKGMEYRCLQTGETDGSSN